MNALEKCAIDLPVMECGASQRVNIVVTCTKRKRLPTAQGFRVRDIEASDIDIGLAKWSERLEECRGRPVAARDLYAGDSWSVVRSLKHQALMSDMTAIIWVCSAGFGLISIDAEICPYSATFSPHHPDSVLRWNRASPQSLGKQLWWQLLGEWGGPEKCKPRSISAVAEMDPHSPLLVVASRDYLQAIGRDLVHALDLLASPDRLIIISTGTKRHADLAGNILPSSANLQRDVGGSLHSLNVRILRKLLSENRAEELYASRLAKSISQWSSVKSRISRVAREAIKDDEVEEYIANALSEDATVGWSSLLRQLRESGWACKQERFASIFRSTRAKII